MSYDLDHTWSGDLVLTASGGFSIVTGTARSEQRVLRRLLTNPGEYWWHPDYGAGLPQYIGTNINLLEVEALISANLALEPAVAQNPPPVIELRLIVGGMFISIKYVDNDTNEQANLDFDLN